MWGLKLAEVRRYVAPLGVNGATPDILIKFNGKA
jgi:hypothetical protein